MAFAPTPTQLAAIQKYKDAQAVLLAVDAELSAAFANELSTATIETVTEPIKILPERSEISSRFIRSYLALKKAQPST